MNLGLMKRRTSQNDLPYDAEVEYLRNSGAEYIYVPIKINNNWSWHLDFMRISNQNAYAAIIYGNPYKIGFWTKTNGIVWTNNTENVYNDITVPRNERIQIDVNRNTIKFSWTETKKTVSSVDYTINGINLFKWGIGDNRGGVHNIYNFYAKDENGIIRINLIPVRIGIVGYVYDKVSGQLFGKLGTSDFILGPDK